MKTIQPTNLMGTGPGTLLRMLAAATLAFPLLVAPVPASADETGFVIKLILPQDAETDPEQIKDLGNAAIERLVAKFVEERGGGNLTRFAVLPLQEDIDRDGYFTVQLENAFTRLGREEGYEFFTRTQGDVATLLDELKWSEDYRDVMDAATVQEFGRLQGVEGVIFTRLDIAQRGNGATTVRVNVQVNEVETGQRHWGYEAKEEGTAPLGTRQIIIVVVIGVPVLVLIALLLKFLRRIGEKARPR